MFIYPNPASDILNIAIKTDEKSETMIQILNSLGQVVYNKPVSLNIGENSIKLDVDDLKNGIYFVRTDINDKIITNKFVK